MLKNFFKDYLYLFKQSCRFCRDHWKGILMICAGSYAVGFGAGFLIINGKEIKQKLKKKFHKKEEA